MIKGKCETWLTLLEKLQLRSLIRSSKFWGILSYFIVFFICSLTLFSHIAGTNCDVDNGFMDFVINLDCMITGFNN